MHRWARETWPVTEDEPHPFTETTQLFGKDLSGDSPRLRLDCQPRAGLDLNAPRVAAAVPEPLDSTIPSQALRPTRLAGDVELGARRPRHKPLLAVKARVLVFDARGHFEACLERTGGVEGLSHALRLRVAVCLSVKETAKLDAQRAREAVRARGSCPAPARAARRRAASSRNGRSTLGPVPTHADRSHSVTRERPRERPRGNVRRHDGEGDDPDHGRHHPHHPDMGHYFPDGVMTPQNIKSLVNNCTPRRSSSLSRDIVTPILRRWWQCSLPSERRTEGLPSPMIVPLSLSSPRPSSCERDTRRLRL